MKHINPKAVISSSAEANGYLKLLKNIGVFKYMVDAYLRRFASKWWTIMY